MNIEKGLFQRTELLLGEKLMKKTAETRVILFGVGGVGSWCAESLVRSGIRHLSIVDFDCICETNINRQLMATTKTLGQAKVEVLKERLLEINPNAEIQAFQMFYNKETSDSFRLSEYDYIIDAIDSLENKVHLIQEATRTPAVFFSSMGAAFKIDASKIQVAEFWKVKGCPLGAALRRRLKKNGMPSKKFLCVFSEELLENKGTNVLGEKGNGTVAHITAIFGFTLAGLVMKDLYKSFV